MQVMVFNYSLLEAAEDRRNAQQRNAAHYQPPPTTEGPPPPELSPPQPPTRVPNPTSEPQNLLNLPPSLLWTPWRDVQLQPLLLPQTAAMTNRESIPVQPSTHSPDKAGITITLQSTIANPMIARYITPTGRVFLAEHTVQVDLPQTIPNLHPASITAWELGINNPTEHHRWATRRLEAHMSCVPQYFIILRVATGVPPRRQDQPQQQHPHLPCTKCRLIDHQITAVNEDMALAQATCRDCQYIHHFQLQPTPATAASKCWLLQAIPTSRTTWVDAVYTRDKGDNSPPTSTNLRQSSPDTSTHLMEADLSRLTVCWKQLQALQSRIQRPPNGSRRSPTLSDSETDGDLDHAGAANLQRQIQMELKNGRPSDTQRTIYKTMMNALKPMDMIPTIMGTSNNLTGQHPHEDSTTLPALFLVMDSENPFRTLADGNLVKIHRCLPTITGKVQEVASQSPYDSVILSNSIQNLSLPHRPTTATGYPELIAGNKPVLMREALTFLCPEDHMNEAVFRDYLGIKRVEMHDMTVLQAFTALAKTTTTAPITSPEAHKVLITFSGLTVIPRHLAKTVLITGPMIPVSTGLPTLP